MYRTPVAHTSRGLETPLLPLLWAEGMRLCTGVCLESHLTSRRELVRTCQLGKGHQKKLYDKFTQISA